MTEHAEHSMSTYADIKFKKTETELTASVLKKDQKHTRD